MTTRPYFGIVECEWEIAVPEGPGGFDDQPQSDIPEDSIASAIPFQPYLIDSSKLTVGELDAHHLVHESDLYIGSGEAEGSVVSTPQLVSQYSAKDAAELYLRLVQYDSPEGAAVYRRVAAGVTQKVHVAGTDGLLVHGHWQADDSGKLAIWKAALETSVQWSIGSRVLSLYGRGIDDDGLLQIAESLGP